jgi:glycosyltransferase involved in cell wall biosynthesis
VSRLILGMDARPALFGRTGFGRVVRESMRLLATRTDVELKPFGAAWQRARPDCHVRGVRSPRIPARLQKWLEPLGFGVEAVLGPLDVYHHTDLVYAPVSRTPEVLTIYDLVFLEESVWHEAGFAKRVMTRLAPRAKVARQIVVPSVRVAEDVMRHGLATPERVVVNPLGADHIDGTAQPGDCARVEKLLEGAGLGSSRGDPLVLVPGTREPRKNQQALLNMFLAGTTPATLLFVGPRGWGCEKLETQLGLLSREPGSRRRVGVAGEVNEEDLAALLRVADLVAYPSFAEGFGLPVAEAMRCGRAVLTSEGTPMADFGGEAVLAVNPRDHSALSDALESLLREPSLRVDLGQAAVKHIAQARWEAHTETLVDVYKAALS